jgi:signal transduction histidine kinase
VRLCLLAGVLLPCGVLAVYLLARQLLIAQFDETLEAKAEALISVAEVDDEEFEIDLDVQHFAGFGSPLTGDFFEVRRSNGEVIARSPSLENQEYTFSTVPSEDEWRGGVVLPEGNPGRAMAIPFVPEDDRAGQFGQLQLVVGSDSTVLLQTLRAMLWTLLITGATGLVAAIVLIRLGLARGLRPLNSLAAEVQELKIDQPGLRLETETLPNELRGVGEKLNRLLERVEASIARERRFSSHAAHELRTPLAELKMMTESVARWPDEATPERNEEMLEVIGEIEQLLEKLSLLARAEAGAYAVQLEQIDLAGSIERAVEREKTAVEARGLEIATRIESGVFRSDAVLWQTILGNLLGNAVAYAPPGSMIEVIASPGFLKVRNPAPDLSPTDMDLLFERFWRKNTAREGGSHSGLGLAIVETAVRLLGGRCEATLERGILQIQIQWNMKE